MEMLHSKYLLFLCGLVAAVQATSLEDILPKIGVQEKTVEEFDGIKSPGSNIKVKELSDPQKGLFSDNVPKMLEKTKIFNKERQLKDQGVEKTKVIYRTRLIGLFSPNTLNNLKKIENIIDIFNESDEDGLLEFNKDTHEKSDTNKVTQTIDKGLEGTTNSEMPLNKHSSKKELGSNEIGLGSSELVSRERRLQEKLFPLRRSKSVDDLTKLQNTPTSSIKKVNFTSDSTARTDLKQPMNTIRHDNFVDTLEDENETGFKPPMNPFRKVPLIDSLELYREQQEKNKHINDLKPNINYFYHVQTLRPLLQRQFSIYRNPYLRVNNRPIIDVDINNEPIPPTATIKSILKHPDETSATLPSANTVNTMSTANNKINEVKPQPSLNSLQSDWLSSLLMKKVAQAEAAHLAQVRAVQSQMVDAHKKEENILRQEQSQTHPFQQHIMV